MRYQRFQLHSNEIQPLREFDSLFVTLHFPYNVRHDAQYNTRGTH